METFKAVEKEMKTKAFSKEGLSQNLKQDPKEKERQELCDFLTDQLEEITRILIEELEPEAGSLQVALKKKQKDNSKAERLAEIEQFTETYKWHESRLQLLLRSLANGNVENDAVVAIKGDIEEVVKEAKEPEFEPEAYEGIYDDLNLDNEEAQFGLANELDHISSQDAQSVPDHEEPEPIPVAAPAKKVKPEPIAARRPSTQLKSPLPALATLNNMPPPPSIPKDNSMKPAPIPNRPPGEVLKYASAAAAAAASDKAGVGIAPLPAPLSTSPATGMTSLPAPIKSSDTESPVAIPAQLEEKSATPPVPIADTLNQEVPSHSKSPTLSATSGPGASGASSVPPTPAMEKADAVPEPVIADEITTTNGEPHEEHEESIYHLPPGLQDLLDSFETTKSRVQQPQSQLSRILQASQESCPEPLDADRPQHYRPTFKYNTPAHYPQDVLPIFDDPALYDNQRMETDTLFYIFYYRQNSYQQWLAARALKNQSWRFHKQYQTWFQRHEEPKAITEEYEQGTYRFFDYESTW